MLTFSAFGLVNATLVVVAIIIFVVFSDRRWRPTRFATYVATQGQAAGLIFLLFVNNLISPWSWSALVAWVIVLLSASVVSTAAAWFTAARALGGSGRRIAGVSLGVVVGAAIALTASFLIRLARADLLIDPLMSIVVIGAGVGGLAGALVMFDRRQAESTI